LSNVRRYDMKHNIGYIKDVLAFLEEHADEIEVALTRSGQWAEFSAKIEEASGNLIDLCTDYDPVNELLKQAEEDGKLRRPPPRPPRPSPGER
jgi:hypothetical protein